MASGTNYSLFRNAPTWAENQGVVDANGLHNLLWGHQVVDEPILVTTKPHTFKLWRKPNAIIRALQYASGQSLNAANGDFVMTDEGIEIPACSPVVAAPAGFLTNVDPYSPSAAQSLTRAGGPLYLGTNFSLYQLAIMYAADPIVAPEVNPLGRFAGLLNSSQPIAASFIGDSIPQGGDCSASLGRMPHAPSYVDLVGAMYSTAAPGRFYWRPQAYAGMSSAGAVAAMGSIFDTPSDKYYIGFGMNDAAGNVSKATFKYNIAQLINGARNCNPNADVHLHTTITSNANWMNGHQRFRGYRDALYELSGEYGQVMGITVSDPASLWEQMLLRKSYADLTSNGVNHPGDFGHKLIAQVLLQTQLGTWP